MKKYKLYLIVNRLALGIAIFIAIVRKFFKDHMSKDDIMLSLYFSLFFGIVFVISIILFYIEKRKLKNRTW